jgi:type VI secretion system protein VasJ
MAKGGASWQWMLYGKHPAALDYIRLGKSSVLGNSVYAWVEQGYLRCGLAGKSQRDIRWRFWMRGAAPEELVCGVLLQSFDAIGRPYPLLLMGSGSFCGWNTFWEHLPMVCKDVWEAAETVSFQKTASLAELENKLSRLTLPIEVQLDDTLPPVVPLKTLSGDLAADFAAFSLEAPNGSQMVLAAAMRLSLELKKSVIEQPVAVFIGGGSTACMVVMRRPLKPLDFETLWNLNTPT